MEYSPRRHPVSKGKLVAVKIAGIYATVASLWIFFSDTLAARLTTNPAAFTQLEIFKGWFFVIVTALMLYWLIQRYVAALQLHSEASGKTETLLRMAQEVAHIGTFEWDIRTGVNRWTAELETMYGLPPGGFAGTREAWEKLVHADDRAEAMQRVGEAMDKGHFEGEWRVPWPDGTDRKSVV